jgi:hypothetical protein
MFGSTTLSFAAKQGHGFKKLFLQKQSMLTQKRQNMYNFVDEPNKNLATKKATLDDKTANQPYFKELPTKRADYTY